MELVADAMDAKIRDECSPGKPMSVLSPTAHKASNHDNSHIMMPGWQVYIDASMVIQYIAQMVLVPWNDLCVVRFAMVWYILPS